MSGWIRLCVGAIWTGRESRSHFHTPFNAKVSPFLSYTPKSMFNDVGMYLASGGSKKPKSNSKSNSPAILKDDNYPSSLTEDYLNESLHPPMRGQAHRNSQTTNEANSQTTNEANSQTTHEAVIHEGLSFPMCSLRVIFREIIIPVKAQLTPFFFSRGFVNVSSKHGEPRVTTRFPWRNDAWRGWLEHRFTSLPELKVVGTFDQRQNIVQPNICTACIFFP